MSILIFGLMLFAGCVSSSDTYSYPLAGQNLEQIRANLTHNGTSWIVIDPVSDIYIGEKFQVTAKTNLSVGTEVTVQTYLINYNPVNSSDSHASAGGVTNVTKGKNDVNAISFIIDSKNFRPEPYLVVIFKDPEIASSGTWYNVSAKPDKSS